MDDMDSVDGMDMTNEREPWTVERVNALIAMAHLQGQDLDFWKQDTSALLVSYSPKYSHFSKVHGEMPPDTERAVELLNREKNHAEFW